MGLLIQLRIVQFFACFPFSVIAFKSSTPAAPIRTSIIAFMSSPAIQVLETGSYGSLYQVSLNLVDLPVNEQDAAFEQSLPYLPTGTVLSWYRFKIWWMRPHWANQVSEIPPETLGLLWKDRDEFSLVLAVVLPENGGCSFVAASLRGDDDNQIRLCSNRPRAGFYKGKNTDPFALLRDGIDMAAGLWNNEPKSSNVSSETTNVPADTKASTGYIMQTTLGFCTWNSLYTSVSGDRLLDTVRTLKNIKRIPFRWIILDDGWQHSIGSDGKEEVNKNVENGEQWSRRLQSLREDPHKFRSVSLKDAVRLLRDEEKLVDAFLVWHTLTGYWLGVNPQSTNIPPATIFRPKFSRGILSNDPSTIKEASVMHGVGIVDDPFDFFRRYHAEYLFGECGVDGVKVDAQAIVGVLFSASQQRNFQGNPPVLIMHTALAKSLHSLPSPKTSVSPVPVIHCMAHSPEIFYCLPSLYKHHGAKPFFRAADDFYPENNESHGAQIVACVFNSLVFGQVAVSDFDMFTTSVPEHFLYMHIVSRCFSGGPIYLSDSPGSESNLKVLEWICCANGGTLPCLQAAIPCEKCLLIDPLDGSTNPLVIWNINGNPITKTVTNGVLGLFYLTGSGSWSASDLDYTATVRGSQQSIAEVRIQPADIPCFKQAKYAHRKFFIRLFFGNRCFVVENPQSSLTINLAPMQTEAVSVYPVLTVQDFEVVALGLLDKINGGGAIVSVEVSDTNTISINVRGNGKLEFAIRHLTSETKEFKVMFVLNDAPLQTSCDQRFMCDVSPSSIQWQILNQGFALFGLDLAPCNAISANVKLFPEKAP